MRNKINYVFDAKFYSNFSDLTKAIQEVIKQSNSKDFINYAQSLYAIEAVRGDKKINLYIPQDFTYESNN